MIVEKTSEQLTAYLIEVKKRQQELEQANFDAEASQADADLSMNAMNGDTNNLGRKVTVLRGSMGSFKLRG